MMPTAIRPAAAVLAGALLYAGAPGPANAAELTPDQRAGIAELRGEGMAKLVLHETPKPAMEGSFLAPGGGEMTLTAFEGQVVVVNFWATWCPPCRAEMPSLDRLSQTLGGEDLSVVAMSTDFGGFSKPQAFFEEIGVESLDVYLDGKRALAREAAVVGLPVTLLLDREGREVGRLIGDAEWDGPEALAVIEALMAATASDGS